MPDKVTHSEHWTINITPDADGPVWGDIYLPHDRLSRAMGA